MTIVTFDIPHRLRHCCWGQEVFTPGMEYLSLLESDHQGKYLRKDYCVPCWKKFSSEVDHDKGHHIYWKSHIPVKKQEPEHSLRRDERALELLKGICQKESVEDASQAYVLALLLSKNRKLLLRQEIKQDNGIPLQFYEVAATEEMLCIKKVPLSSIQAEQIQQILAEKLQCRS